MEKVFVSPMTYRQGENVLWDHLKGVTSNGSICLRDDWQTFGG